MAPVSIQLHKNSLLLQYGDTDRWLTFESIALVPFEKKLIQLELLTRDQVRGNTLSTITLGDIVCQHAGRGLGESIIYSVM